MYPLLNFFRNLFESIFNPTLNALRRKYVHLFLSETVCWQCNTKWRNLQNHPFKLRTLSCPNEHTNNHGDTYSIGSLHYNAILINKPLYTSNDFYKEPFVPCTHCKTPIDITNDKFIIGTTNGETLFFCYHAKDKNCVLEKYLDEAIIELNPDFPVYNTYNMLNDQVIYLEVYQMKTTRSPTHVHTKRT